MAREDKKKNPTPCLLARPLASTLWRSRFLAHALFRRAVPHRCFVCLRQASGVAHAGGKYPFDLSAAQGRDGTRLVCLSAGGRGGAAGAPALSFWQTGDERPASMHRSSKPCGATARFTPQAPRQGQSSRHGIVHLCGIWKRAIIKTEHIRMSKMHICNVINHIFCFLCQFPFYYTG